MRTLLKSITLITLSLCMSSAANAIEFKGDTKRVVIILETDKTKVGKTGGVRMNFCPVDANKTFRGSCAGKAYSFPGWSKKVYDIVVNDAYEYKINWMTPKAKGLYAFGNGTISNGISATLYGPGTHTQAAMIAGGTVAVFTRLTATRKSEYANAVKRAKAVFKKQYGAAITNKMKFVAFRNLPVTCKFKNSFFEYQINHNKCTLK